MTGSTNELAIRSRYGVLRDLVPVYSLYQLVPNLVGLGLALWLVVALGRFPPILAVPLLLGWLVQYQSRPATMQVSQEQAGWLEALLDAQRFFDRSEADGRWRTTGKQAWQRWPHQSIAFAPGNGGATVIAPRDIMESMRDAIELAEEQGELLYVDESRSFQFEEPEQEVLPGHMRIPAVAIAVLCVAAWFWRLFSGGMMDWGLSAAALAQGRLETIFLHMFAHGGAVHLFMNMSVLVGIGGTLVARLGGFPFGWLRFFSLYLLSGLAGAALFVALHPWGTVPMVGASGALYGLVGLLVRIPAGDGALLSVRSSKMRRIGWDLVKQNAFLFGLLALMAWSSGGAGGLAWEAHLGGFLFGLLAGPKLLPRAVASDRPETIDHPVSPPLAEQR